MAKNIVLCLDGTGNQLKAKGNTNVVEIFSMLSLTDPTKQVGFYDPGVGTFSSAAAWTPLARWLSRLWGLAAGGGMRQNLIEAYTFLMQNYEPGDRVFVFGFSRGAYTARALAGLVSAVGIFRPGAENVVPYAVSSYIRKDKSDDDWKQIRNFTNNFSRRVGESTRTIKVSGVPKFAFEFIGIFDTVKAAGILRWDAKWPWTRSIANAFRVRHAVSIDEKRRPYRDYRAFVYEASVPAPQIEEVLFAGVHSDVGGTFEDDPRLAKITLKWMMEGAWQAGVLFKRGAYKRVCDEVSADNASGTIHRMGWIWALLTYKRRTLRPTDYFHASVRPRAEQDAKYRARLPPNPVYVDDGWELRRTR